jgi:putative MATE family efflux protein
MMIMAGVNVLAVVMDYSLILGAGPFPRLGVLGAAMSSNIARTGGCLASLYCLARSPLRDSLRWGGGPSLAWFQRTLSIGMPTAVQTLLRTVGSMTFVSILGRLPDSSTAVAALTIGVRTEAISFMPGLAFSAAATSMVGQNLGARQPERAEDSAWVCVKQAAAIMCAVGAAFFFLSRPIARCFTTDPAIVAYTAAYLRANGVAQPMLAFGMVLSGALQGAGETKVPAWVTFATMWGVRLPASYVVALVLGLGAPGAWWTMTASAVLYGLIIIGIFRRGKWRTREV